ncbi:MAG: hypothetical protein KA109_02820 [Saprospiraceae bacterium]|jgi:hypothetical protein|nr:CcoQ/FixQ family Cbb3-type cytochrome c oxidase assembly chaperone [Saprospiraceae bacterium]MBK6476857.1 CcoQ/FixQ family Cbb3-type cytochrome c oxidase assembly chaperone [Saprospiraceae bacterium]MBK6816116.1 CcoQ/FixQ family Cbb3-type cytochrome c oxidase assembly chaperone [Saprospiraceae bacterium]MBK7370231.1 CcoQ/FixQ family Cbb3-type cytochrome c oxidase assembly chaperone [Saprospiraceae bacterium]MBK7437938.1 CcoQ/FixQ family Cbb3-type cytochrome c oxidase assembly chaperone [Sapr
MKYSNYLTSIENVQWYPLLSLILFIGVFTGMAIYIFKTDKTDMEERAKIPLD